MGKKWEREGQWSSIYIRTAGMSVWLGCHGNKVFTGWGLWLLAFCTGVDTLHCVYVVVAGLIGSCCPTREVSSFQRVVCTGFNGVGT